MTKRTSAPKPFYTTSHGQAFLGDSRTLLPTVADSSINLILTSPPYALYFKKAYGKPMPTPSSLSSLPSPSPTT
jgi:site-specific DNA-methyltransferase (cytosine-N4-specific)